MVSETVCDKKVMAAHCADCPVIMKQNVLLIHRKCPSFCLHLLFFSKENKKKNPHKQISLGSEKRIFFLI